MITRLLLLTLGIALFAASVWLWRRFVAWRLTRLAQTALPTTGSSALPTADDAQPSLLFFTAEWCAQCKLSQSPILVQLAEITGVPVRTVDAVAEEELARHFGVMTVPTTVVLDRGRRPVAVNYGLASLQTLQAQLAGAG